MGFIFLKNCCADIPANTYFYPFRGRCSPWYENYRLKALLTSYDDTEKGINYRR